jgi:HAD superfamily phosphatase (TIGR01668 family)
MLLDIDNTLLSPMAMEMDAHTQAHVLSLAKQGTILLCTNNMTDRQRNVAKALHLPILMQAMKPLTFRVSRFLKRHGIASHQVVVVGDQWITDGWLANAMHCPLIWLEPMAEDRNIMTRLLRRLEKRWKP